MSPMLCRSGNALVSEDGGGRKVRKEDVSDI